ncbi:uncharacterized protein LOC135477238 [Liolophura sinensis]|uniref:uncharacterized protein LOC135477238 n=1 Tax=Liolophura sinensis TaxID=3198878 RepID=UPI0031583907
MVVTSASAYVCLLGVLYAAVFTTTDDTLKGSNKTAVYTLTFYTCDVEQAGTEDVVNVTLTGCSRESVALQFDGEDAQGNLTIFSQGNTYINKKEVTDVGPIFQILVKRNETKPNDGWKLGNVRTLWFLVRKVFI